MRLIPVTLALLALLAGAVHAAEGDFTELTGVPVMAGLAEVPDSLVVFDKEEGRIIEAAAEGEATAADAAAFYREALHQLGWALEGESPAALRFTRDGERLAIEFAAGARLVVRFRLGPEQ